MAQMQFICQYSDTIPTPDSCHMTNHLEKINAQYLSIFSIKSDSFCYIIARGVRPDHVSHGSNACFAWLQIVSLKCLDAIVRV